MPELPEVETICKRLQTAIINQTIKKIIIRVKSLRWPIDPTLPQTLSNKIIKKIYRRAKYLLIECSNGYLIIHLGMSGKISILSQSFQNYNTINKHDHVDLILKNKTIVRYNDPRRFGAILWTTNNPLNHPLLKNLGPEPFDINFSAEYLFKKANKLSLPIKQFIMNNKVVVGIGNIYANEALFMANINPNHITKNISLNKLQDLVVAIKEVLKTAILAGGTTLKDFYDPHGNPGYFAQNLKIYGRSNQPCLVCSTIIEQIKTAQRSTFFCKTCQPY